jgi:hypothetical protein
MKPLLICLVTLLGAFDTSACATTAPGLRPLSSSELENLITGKSIQLDIRTFDAGTVESFWPNGRWELTGGRAAHGGQYYFRDGTVCVDSPPRSTFCRRIYTSADGYFMEREPGRIATSNPIPILTIKPL